MLHFFVSWLAFIGSFLNFSVFVRATRQVEFFDYLCDNRMLFEHPKLSLAGRQMLLIEGCNNSSGKFTSMSSTGNCYNNAVAESFFGLLKRERINRVRYRTREEARADVFEYIEVFYNRKRRHGFLGNISPAEFEHKTTGLYETVH